MNIYIYRKVPFCKGFLDEACMATVKVWFGREIGFVVDILPASHDLVVQCFKFLRYKLLMN